MLRWRLKLYQSSVAGGPVAWHFLSVRNPDDKLVATGGVFSMGLINFWLADDDAELRQVMAQTLNLTPGMRLTREFASAEALIRALKSGPAPHVVVLDLKMMGMSGADAVAPIKQLAPQIHVIIFTTFHDGAAQQKALAAGAAGFVLKRNGVGSIVGTVKNLLQLDPALLALPGKGIISALPPSNP